MRTSRLSVSVLVLTAACGTAVDVPGDTADTASDESTTFRVALMADSHVIGDDYRCCESAGLDTESIYRTRRRLQAVGALVGEVDPLPEFGLLAGDVVHQAFKHEEVDAYLDPDNRSAFWYAKQLLGEFPFPMYLGWGNHDYEAPEFTRDFAHQVQDAVFGQPPFQAVDAHGWTFLVLNTQLGRTWSEDPMDAFLDRGVGSLGREQLAWVSEQLDRDRPTILVMHHPPFAGVLKEDEDPDGPIPDVFSLIEAHEDHIAGVYFGHTHRWIPLDTVFDVPSWVLGAIRYDADNYWVLELDKDGDTVTTIDADKVNELTPYAYGTDYTAGGAETDFTESAEDDPAGPWGAYWEDQPPDPWPPPEGEEELGF